MGTHIKINAFVKNRGRQFTSNPSQQPSSSRRRGLANHPLSCHPQRSVWQPRKGKENERKWRKEVTGKLPLSITDVK